MVNTLPTVRALLAEYPPLRLVTYAEPLGSLLAREAHEIHRYSVRHPGNLVLVHPALLPKIEGIYGYITGEGTRVFEDAMYTGCWNNRLAVHVSEAVPTDRILVAVLCTMVTLSGPTPLRLMCSGIQVRVPRR